LSARTIPFSEFSPAKTVTAGNIADRARAFAIPPRVIDGNDVTAVWKAAKTAVERARNGGGPSFIEAHNLPYPGSPGGRGICSWVASRYREPEEIESWKTKGPIEFTRKQLEAGGPAAVAQLQEIETRVMARVDAAVRFAVESPPADPELVFSLMFDGQGRRGVFDMAKNA